MRRLGLRYCLVFFFFFQAEDGIRDLVRSRGLGDVYKRQAPPHDIRPPPPFRARAVAHRQRCSGLASDGRQRCCLLYTSDAADERSSVDLGGRRIIKKKKKIELRSKRAIEI